MPPFLRSILGALCLVAALVIAAPASADVPAPGDFSPAVWSDKPDYMPGEQVTLYGANWTPGETVHLTVNDDAGSTWTRSVDVTADETGGITDTFNLPDWFVAQYTVRATGASSGAVATTTFTDGTVKARSNAPSVSFTLTKTVYLSSSDCGATGSPTGTTTTAPGVTSPSGHNTGLGSDTESVKLEATATSDQGGAFTGWTSSDPFSTINSRTICVKGFRNGNQEYVANYGPGGNVAPVVNPTGDATADEGETKVYNAGATDADNDSLTYSWSVLSGNATIPAGGDTAANVSVTFAEGPGTVVLRVSVNDGHGHTVTGDKTVTVANVAPSATFANDGPINEGGSANVSFTGATDPSAVDTTAGFRYSISCAGDTSALATTYAGAGTTSSSSCSFGESGSYTVVARIFDEDNGSRDYSTTVVVTNVAPTADLGNNGPVDEGSAATISFTNASDPSSADTTAGFHYAFRCDGDASQLPTTYADAGASSSTSCTFDDNGSHVIRGRIFDEDGDSTTYSTTVVVNNVAPSADLGDDGPIDEGGSATVSFSGASDPSSADTAAGFKYSFSCAGDETALATSYATAGAASSTSCSFDDDGSKTVKGRIFDKDGGSRYYSTTVVVNNVAPSADLGNNGPVDEGSSATVSFSNESDPSSADTAAGFRYSISCAGDESALATTYAGAGADSSKSCPFDDNGSKTVKGRIFDKDGGSRTYSTTVVVNNVAPSADLGNNGPKGEGSAATVSFSNASDPSSVDTAAGFRYSIDCSGDENALATSYLSAGTASSKSCSFDDEGSYTVKGRIFDKDGGSNTYSTTVVVENVAPTATFTNNGPKDEGSAATVSLTSPSDPSQKDTAAGFRYSISCEGDTGALATSYADAGADSSRDCTFDDNGNHTVKGRIFDEDGGNTTYSTTVVVDNVAPTAALSNDGPVDEGSPATASFGAVTDPSAADATAGFRYSISCAGDASALASTYGGAATSSSKSCTYPDNGDKTVVGRIFDKDGGYTTHQTTVKVNNVAPTITEFSGTDSLSGPLTFAPSTFKTVFTDPGSADTHTGLFAWSSGTPPTTLKDPFASEDTVNHSFTTASCSRSETVKVTDDDGGYDTETTTVKVGTGAWQPPLANQPVSDKLKNGQVLPVKIKIADCNGISVGGLVPVIQLIKGDLTAVADDSTELITTSVSSADTGQYMRAADGMYVYNLRVSVASSSLGQDHTIIIYPYGTAQSGLTLRHVIVPIK